MKTEQEIFDEVLSKLRKQGKPSMRGFACLYRGPESMKCAVGHLIPDTHYLPEFDASSFEEAQTDVGYLSAFNAKFREALRAGGVDCGEARGLLIALQTAHDGWAIKGIEYWENLMEGVAKRWNLSYTQPKERNHAD